MSHHMASNPTPSHYYSANQKNFLCSDSKNKFRMLFEKIYHRFMFHQIEDEFVLLSIFFSLINGFAEVLLSTLYFTLSTCPVFIESETFSLSRSISTTRTRTCCHKETTSIG
ncbi:MAG: hypothetical protein RL023_380 [Candidatus Parcubacteria bacterium]